MSLSDVTVLDFSSAITGPYATKLFVDAGATVIKVEPAAGDPLRHWTASGHDLGDQDSPLFEYLNAGKQSIVASADDASVGELLARADLLVEDTLPGAFDLASLRARHPALVHLSITPWGREGPYAERPSTEFTLQAEAGSIAARGLVGQEPYQAGGRLTEWVAGAYAAVAALAALRGARRDGHGEFIDFSVLEATNLVTTNYSDLFRQVIGDAMLAGPAASVETPSVEPTLDGYVGFCTNTAQQFSDFLLLIERPDLRDDSELSQYVGRAQRFDEWNAIVQGYTRQQKSADLIERASLLRIPVAPVNSGESVPRHEQLAERGVYRRSHSGRSLVPRPPYRIDSATPTAPKPAPRLGEQTGKTQLPSAPEAKPSGSRRLPLEGFRVLDATAWWAGPSTPHILGLLGAEVIHVESIQRPDGMRMTGGMMRGREAAWWECSPFFAATNTNKRGITLNLAEPAGVALFEKLAARCDLLVENFTPRVFDGFGITQDRLRELNPRLIFMRMPAFGLTGPWRDNTGFAQTMEQLSGMAWRTGHPEDQPRIPRGPCDPNAGMHAAFAALVALAGRDQSGRGSFVESTMVEAALNVAAEGVIEQSAHGVGLERLGNRSYEAAPQGLYACAGSEPGRERWLALSVATDAQWSALVECLGAPSWASAGALASFAGRRAAQDAIDAELRRCFQAQELDAAVEMLIDAGVPAAPVCDPRLASRHPQLVSRGYFENLVHPVLGAVQVATLPFRFASIDRFTRRPAPTLGQHNHEVLSELLGLDAAQLEELEERGIIGTRPVGA